MDTFMSGYMMSETMFSVQTCMFKTTVSKYGHIQVWLYDVRESMFSRLQHILVPIMDTFMFGYMMSESPCSPSKHACSRLQHIPAPNMDTFVFGYMMSEPMFSVKHAFLRLQHIPVPNMDTCMSGYTMSQSPCSQSKHACLRPRILEVLIGTFVDIYKKSFHFHADALLSFHLLYCRY